MDWGKMAQQVKPNDVCLLLRPHKLSFDVFVLVHVAPCHSSPTPTPPKTSSVPWWMIWSTPVP